MPPYHPGQIFDSDDKIIIVSKVASRIINYVL
jgi:hypothetical protein